MHCVYGVKHFQGLNSNIERYSQCPLSRLLECCLAAPSTVTPVKSLFNSHALCSWSQTFSRQYQQYSQTFAAPSNTVALILPHSAVYRHSSKMII